MNRRERIVLLLNTLADVRPETPTWTGEAAGEVDSLGWSSDETRQLYRQGDYHALERSLASLHSTHPRLYRRVWRHYVLGQHVPAVNRNQKGLATGMRLLERRMPRSVKVPKLFLQLAADEYDFTPGRVIKPSGHRKGQLNRFKRGERDRAVIADLDDGMSDSDAADKYGLNRATVWRIRQIAT
jgi:hypothetical protein